MRMKMSFTVFEILPFGFAEFWKSYGNVSKGVRTKPCTYSFFLLISDQASKYACSFPKIDII